MTEEEKAAHAAAVAQANAEAKAAQEASTKAADEAAAKVAEVAAVFERIKAEAPAVNDIAAVARKTAEDVEALKRSQEEHKRREQDAALIRHVRGVMHYEGCLDNEDLLPALRRAGADPSTKEGLEKFESFREKHIRDFPARTIPIERSQADLRTALDANPKIKANPFFSFDRGAKSLGRKK